MKFNISRLINDVGGATEVAKKIGKHRTAPYGWINRNKMSTETLSLIKKNFKVNIDEYFETSN